MNRFTFKSMNYSVDVLLDSIFSKCISSGIKSVTSKGEFWINIEFKNGVEVKAWNADKYYEWLSKGIFYFSDGRSYRWDGSRPSRLTMNMLYKALIDFDMIGSYSDIAN